MLKKGIGKRKFRNCRRAFAAIMASAMILTSSGFQTLAAEASQTTETEAAAPQTENGAAPSDIQVDEKKETEDTQDAGAAPSSETEAAPAAEEAADPETAADPAPETEPAQDAETQPSVTPEETASPAPEAGETINPVPETDAVPEGTAAPSPEAEQAIDPAAKAEETAVPKPEEEGTVTPIPETEGEASQTEEDTVSDPEGEECVTPAPDMEETESPAPEQEEQAQPEKEEQVQPEEEENGQEKDKETPKTSFAYEDSRVRVTAAAQETAALPQAAELRADYIAPGTERHRESAAVIEGQLLAQLGGTDENAQVEYVLYDVYFCLPDGSRVEPEAGSVKVEMSFKLLQALETERKIVHKDVVHIRKDGRAEIVTDYINTNENGEVTSMGFTQDSFSVTGAALTTVAVPVELDLEDAEQVQVRSEEAEQSDQLADFVKNVEVFVNDESYEGEKFRFKVSFDERVNRAKRLAKTVVYQLPKDYLVNWDESGTLMDPSDQTKTVGNYTVDKNGLVTITFTDEFYAKSDTGLISGAFFFEAGLKYAEEQTEIKIPFPGLAVNLTVQLDNKVTLKTEKTYVFDPEAGTFTFTIKGTALSGTATGVKLTDRLGAQLQLLGDGAYELRYEPDKPGAVKSGRIGELDADRSFSVSAEDLSPGQTVSMTYQAILTPDAMEIIKTGGKLVSAKNSAKVTTDKEGKNENEVEVDVGEDYYREYARHNWLVKEGTFDNEKCEMKWVFTYSAPPGVSLKDSEVKDTLEDLDGNVFYDTDTCVFVTRSDGKTFTIDFESSTRWSYKIGTHPEDGYEGNENAFYSYTFSYSSVVNRDWKDALLTTYSVKNTVEDNWKHWREFGGELPGIRDYSLEKNAVNRTEDYMEWSASIKVPANGGGNYWAMDHPCVHPVDNNGKTYWGTCIKLTDVSAALIEEEGTKTAPLKCVAQYDEKANQYCLFFGDQVDAGAGLDENKRNSALPIQDKGYEVCVTYRTPYQRANGETWSALLGEGRESLPALTVVYNTMKLFSPVGFSGLVSEATAKIPEEIEFEKWFDDDTTHNDWCDDVQLPNTSVGERYRYCIRLDPNRVGIQGVFITDCHSEELRLVKDKVYLVWNKWNDPSGFYDCEPADRCWVDEGCIEIVDDGTFTIDLSQYIPAQGYDMYSNPCAYRLYYVMELKDSNIFTGPEGIQLTNTAKIKYNDDMATTSAPPIKYVNLPLKKELLKDGFPSRENDYTAKFQISLTALKKFIDEETRQLIIRDVRENLDLRLDTIQVTENDVPLGRDRIRLILTGNGLDIIVFNAVENAQYDVTYDAVVKGAWGEEVEFSNTASVPGGEECSDAIEQAIEKTQDSNGTAQTAEYSVQVYKYDESNTAAALGGARFDLYRVNEKGTKCLRKDLETNKEGKFDAPVQLKYADDKEVLEAYVQYYLVETKAPDGYVKNSEPIYFYFDDGTQEDVTGLQGLDLSSAPYTLYVANQGEAGVELKAEKSFNVKYPEAGFAFLLTGKGNAPMPDGADENGKTVRLTQDGEVSFGAIDYERAGDYDYEIREVIPWEKDRIPGLTYDEKVYEIRVHVDADMEATVYSRVKGQGNYEQETTEDHVYGFANRAKVSASIEAVKTLTGRKLKEGEFKFRLEAVGNAPMPAVSLAENGADGSFSFGPMDYTEAGTYQYILKEVVNSGDAATQYDLSEKPVTVEVTDNGEGALSAKVVYPEGMSRATFVNKNRVVSIAKVEAGKMLRLEGAHLQLLDSTAKIIKEWDSTKEIHQITGLKPGVYTLKETSAPNGYMVAAETRFELKDDGTVNAMTTAMDENGVLLVKDEKTKVSIRKVDIADRKPLAGAHLQILEAGGAVVADWTSAEEDYLVEGLKTETAYTLREISGPAGYGLAEDTVFQLRKDGTVDLEKTSTASENGVLLVEDKRIQTADTSVTVVKTVSLDGMPLMAQGFSFYVALYYDKECTRMAAPIQEIRMENASSTEVTFDNLEVGRAYYVGECDASGRVIYSGEIEGVTTYQAKFTGTNGNYVVTTEGGNTRVALDNQMAEMPNGFYVEGQLHVTKKLLGKDGSPKKSREVFYAGVFEDPDHTKLSSVVVNNILKLDLAGGSEAEAATSVMLPDKDSTEVLYVTEVDEKGTPVSSDPGFAYRVTVKGDAPVIDGENLEAGVVITNQEIEEEIETEEETEEKEETETPETKSTVTPTPVPERTGNSPQTGDGSPILPAAAALVISGLVILLLLYRRYRRRA
ncbi:MAG: FctA domain-containing protein [Eubacteriales bacterium]|nr:FctA domain-containing protein [Eubacteriales bacterium]